MDRFEVKKKYRTETREYPHLEATDEQRTYEVEILLVSQDEAIDLAEKEAAKQRFASVSLIRENHDAYIFEFYNPIPEPEKTIIKNKREEV